jgi:hypothetical protein
MNYSASEAYSEKCESFRRRQVGPSQVKSHWFGRNYYVLYQSKGYFKHNTWVFAYNEFPFPPEKCDGNIYGPFTKPNAYAFAHNVKRTHENFVLGG